MSKDGLKITVNRVLKKIAQCFDKKNQTVLAVEALIPILKSIAEDVKHTHNLQHGIIHEIINISLHDQYKMLGINKTIEFNYEQNEIKLFLPTGPSDYIQRNILATRTFFDVQALEMIREHVPMQGQHVLDVGAFIGNHTVFFSKICGASLIDCFEPVQSSFQALQKNIALNEVKAHIHNCGLGAAKTTARAEVNPINAGGSTLVTGSKGPIEIIPLDSFGLPPFSFIKIDVEGMAKEVLLGAKSSIERNKPHIVIEAFPHEFEEINGILTSFNYERRAKHMDDYVYRFKTASN